jgi:rhodanese-related sulfurtransferase
MKITYIILGVLLVAVAITSIFLPQTKYNPEKEAELLLDEIIDDSRFLSTDEIAATLIDEDPTLLLVDVRDQEAYNSFSLPGALNIQLKDLLNEEWIPYLKDKGLKKVFYSNGEFDAEKAWLVTSRMKYPNVYIMKGGLNNWAKNILNPEKPPQTASAEEHDLYTFRVGASMYFKGFDLLEESRILQSEWEANRKKNIIPKPEVYVPKPKKVVKPIPVIVEEEEEDEGGC